ncbi:MAG: Xylose isomerase-like TIM barrel [Lentisphaerae bacterium ADurb.BinA184]|mgnify:CR=1 FL=1|nr:MAG: Xylose isomerase-like TIM barrel [Lentisphaerae bacterium ADurb.BinA184]
MKAQTDIRIGTLANASSGAGYLRQIIPHGFESFELTLWMKLDGVNLKKLAAEVRQALDETGNTAVISSLGIYGNPLMSEESVEAWKACIDNVHLFGADLVCGFAGRLKDKPVPDSMPAFKKVFTKLAQRAADKGVRLAFENCDMGGTWETGDWNIAHAPAAWEMMFAEVPADNLGLEWEPCHQINSLVDPLPQLRKWIKRIFHLHGKDATLFRDVVKEHGIRGGKPYVYHRTPGFGDTNWADVISILRMGGFTGAIDIEGWHDPVYRGDLEMTGQVHGLNYLKRCRGGNYIANPT